MKLRHLFMAVLASAFAFTSCDEEIDLGVAKVSFVEPAGLVLDFGPEESSSTVTFVCTRDWDVSEVLSGSLPEWIALSATSGAGSTEEQSVTVTVNENPGNDRETTVTFTIGLAKAALTVHQRGRLGEVQPGTGTKEDPYTVAGVIAYLETLGAGVNSPDKVFVKGKIASIKEEFGTQYGNATFNMWDDEGGPEFTAFRVLYLGNQKWAAGDTQIKVGDEVIVYGNVVNFMGNTPETQQGNAFLFSLNGVDKGGDNGGGNTQTGEAKGTGTQADPFNVAAAIAKAVETGQTETSVEYYIKGKVATVKEAFNAQYGNGTFELKDEGSDAIFTAYRILYFDNKKWTENDKTVNVGDEIVVVGKIVNFRGNTPETAQGTGWLYSLNGETGGTTTEDTYATPAGTGTPENPFNVSRAIEKAKGAPEDGTPDWYYVKGKVSAVKEAYGAQYGNGTFELVDEGYTAVFTAFRILYFNSQKWQEGDQEVKVGDELIVRGRLVNYKGNTPETVQGTGSLYALNGKTDGGEPPVQDEIVSVTIAEFLAAQESSAQRYKLHGKMSNIKNTTYGNFDLVDETGTSVYVYGLTSTELGYGASNDKSFASLNLAEGDEITIVGYRGSYNGQAQALYSYFVEKTGGEEPPVVVEVKPVTVAEFIAAEESNTQKYQLTGKISGNINTTYGNFDLVDDTGSVYVYGLTATDLGYGGKNDKSFESLNLAEGDVITIIGYRGSYNGKIEVLNAYFVEKVSGGTPAEPYIRVKSIAQTATRGFSVAWETNVTQATYYSWSLYRLSDQSEDGVMYAAMGRLTDVSVTSLNAYDGSPDGAGWYEDLIPGEKYYFAINIYVAGDVNPTASNDPEAACFEAKDMSGSGDKTEITIALTNATTFAADNGGDTLKDGWAATVAGWKVATYKYKSTSNSITPDEYSMRVYKSAVFYIEAPDGAEIKKLVFKANNYSSGKYILDMTGVEGTSGTATADKTAETITWEAASAGVTKVILQADAGQTRVESVTVTY